VLVGAMHLGHPCCEVHRRKPARVENVGVGASPLASIWGSRPRSASAALLSLTTAERPVRAKAEYSWTRAMSTSTPVCAAPACMASTMAAAARQASPHCGCGTRPVSRRCQARCWCPLPRDHTDVRAGLIIEPPNSMTAMALAAAWTALRPRSGSTPACAAWPRNVAFERVVAGRFYGDASHRPGGIELRGERALEKLLVEVLGSYEADLLAHGEQQFIRWERPSPGLQQLGGVDEGSHSGLVVGAQDGSVPVAKDPVISEERLDMVRGNDRVEVRAEGDMRVPLAGNGAPYVSRVAADPRPGIVLVHSYPERLEMPYDGVCHSSLVFERAQDPGVCQEQLRQPVTGRKRCVDHFSRRCAIAAPTKSRNSGCGLVGRLLNSGWNWQATNHGCSGSSMSSTRRSSGVVPLMTSPAFSSSSRKTLLTS